MNASVHHPAAIVILAAGAGTRMRSDLPKPLHRVAGEPMLGHVMRAARAASPEYLAVVVQDAGDAVAQYVRQRDATAVIAAQPQRRGTGEAARIGLESLPAVTGPVIVIYADAPLLGATTLTAMTATMATGVSIVALGFTPQQPGRYGRLARDVNGDLERIVEAADATAEERAIGLCNAGPMAFDATQGRRWLTALTADNAQGEFYLTDLIALARAEGERVAIAFCDSTEASGVNARDELAAVEAAFQRRARAAAMADGVTMMAPDTVWLTADTRLGHDVTLGPNVVFGPGVTVEPGATIDAFCHLEGCVVRAGAVIGPFARLRPGADIGPAARVGNFVEIKNATLGQGTKVNHLSYVGDAAIGADANLGAGTITCNYDGVAKHRTEVGQGAFIGSNTALVAPVRIGAGAYTGSGSVITSDVPENALAIARARQTVKPGLAARLRARLGAPSRDGGR